ncbi:MAG: hypothetical protein Q8N17_05960 [Burkholderiaceae bacterium]|nr:hypothetical protein [Burkholderiaceae bacterium]
MSSSRLRIDPSTLLPSIQTFGELNQFLRGAKADKETARMGESMAALAAQIEAVVAGLQQGAARAELAPVLMDLLTHLRHHRTVVIGLSPAWRGLYEYASYLSALNNFRVLIGQWLLEGAEQAELAITIENFELIAWRTLGEGMLMIDMYEQWRSRREGESSGNPGDTSLERAKSWWSKLRR